MGSGGIYENHNLGFYRTMRSNLAAEALIRSPIAVRSSVFIRPPRCWAWLPPQGMSERIKRIKDVSFEKEVLRDVTAAEFAMVVVGSTRIDYDKLIENLQCNVELLEVRLQGSAGGSGDTARTLLQRVKDTKAGLEKFIQSREYKQRMKDLKAAAVEQERERRKDWTIGMPMAEGSICCCRQNPCPRLWLPPLPLILWWSNRKSEIKRY